MAGNGWSFWSRTTWRKIDVSLHHSLSSSLTLREEICQNKNMDTLEVKNAICCWKLWLHKGCHVSWIFIVPEGKSMRSKLAIPVCRFCWSIEASHPHPQLSSFRKQVQPLLLEAWELEWALTSAPKLRIPQKYGKEKWHSKSGRPTLQNANRFFLQFSGKHSPDDGIVGWSILAPCCGAHSANACWSSKTAFGWFHIQKCFNFKLKIDQVLLHWFQHVSTSKVCLHCQVLKNPRFAPRTDESVTANLVTLEVGWDAKRNRRYLFVCFCFFVFCCLLLFVVMCFFVLCVWYCLFLFLVFLASLASDFCGFLASGLLASSSSWLLGFWLLLLLVASVTGVCGQTRFGSFWE